MASSIEYVTYCCDQMSQAGEITYKKMFGEFGIYLNGKIIGLICDNQLFIKKTAAGENLTFKFEEVSPYNGAKPHYVIENMEDREFLGTFLRNTFDFLPVPKPKKQKKG